MYVIDHSASDGRWALLNCLAIPFLLFVAAIDKLLIKELAWGAFLLLVAPVGLLFIPIVWPLGIAAWFYMDVIRDLWESMTK
jgi:hypothetical protein